MKKFSLDDGPKINPGFKIPENYFDDFTQKMIDRLPETETKAVPINRHRNTWIYSAAAVLVLSLSIPALDMFSTSSAITDQASIENYITYHSDISDDEIVDLLETEEIENINIHYNIEENAVDEILSSGVNVENIIN